MRYIKVIIASLIIPCSTFLAQNVRASMVNEVGDAGHTPATAQIATGLGSLLLINGFLDDALDVDMYAIIIDGGGTFSASTTGLSDVDTRLFLFDSEGRGVYGNDDRDVFTLQSTLPAQSILTPAAGGQYYLVVTSYDIRPFGVNGPIFSDSVVPDDIVGPKDANAIVLGYSGSGELGAYSISLTGAQLMVPEPKSELLFIVGCAGILAALSRGRGCVVPLHARTYGRKRGVRSLGVPQ